MIISDKHRFVFVHVPKCAGTSVRKALAPYDDYHGWFNDRIDNHCKFGELDFVHLPLEIMQTVLPKEYKKVVSYDAFAFIRDPESRFQSAFAQYVKVHRKIELAQMENKEINREVSNIINILNSSEFLIKPELIHFMRQECFLKDQSGYHVENIYPLTEVDRFLADISKKIGDNITLDINQNRTLVMKAPFLRRPAMYASHGIKRILPTSSFNIVRQAARHLLMRPVGGEIIKTFQQPSIREFIHAYYESDFRLYENIKQKYKLGVSMPC